MMTMQEAIAWAKENSNGEGKGIRAKGWRDSGFGLSYSDEWHLIYPTDVCNPPEEMDYSTDTWEFYNVLEELDKFSSFSGFSMSLLIELGTPVKGIVPEVILYEHVPL